LVVLAVSRFLLLNIFTDRFLISADSRDKISACPKVIPFVIADPPQEVPGDVNRTLPFQVTNNIRNSILGRNRKQRMYMAYAQMALDNLTVLLPGKVMEHLLIRSMIRNRS